MCLIIVSNRPSNVYLPPPSTDYPIQPPQQDEFDMNGYLPPFNDPLPPPQTTEPSDVYLPPVMVCLQPIGLAVIYGN